MKRAVLVALVLFAALVIGRPGEAQIPASGLSSLLCTAGIHGNGTYSAGPSGRLVIEISDDNGSSAQIHIIHGGDDSSHTLTYSDTNQNGLLDCGDIVRTVS